MYRLQTIQSILLVLIAAIHPAFADTDLSEVSQAKTQKVAIYGRDTTLLGLPTANRIKNEKKQTAKNAANAQRSPDALDPSCTMHARKMVWTPALAGMLEASAFSLNDFKIISEVANEPSELSQAQALQRDARTRQEKELTEQVINSFRQFEELFQDLYGLNNEKLDDAQFMDKEFKRAEYWATKAVEGFTPEQKKRLRNALSKWIKLYFKTSIPAMPSNIKRIVVKRIQTFETVFGDRKIPMNQIFCFDS